MTTKKALIIGLSGGFGYHMAKALKATGWTLSHFSSANSLIDTQFKEINKYEGRLPDQCENLEQAIIECDIVIYGANIPYDQWGDKVEAMLSPVLNLIQEHKKRLIFPGNIYPFNPEHGPIFDNNSPLDPIHKKGQIRQRMTASIKMATTQGAKALIMRCGDFFGTHTPNSWFQHLIAGQKNWKTSITCAGPQDQLHSWAYLPDVADNICKLLDLPEGLSNYDEFTFQGHEITFCELKKTLDQIAGAQSNIKIKKFPWLFIRLGAVFHPMARELLEMRYLWQHQMGFCGKKLNLTLKSYGGTTHTPLKQALKATLMPH